MSSAAPYMLAPRGNIDLLTFAGVDPMHQRRDDAKGQHDGGVHGSRAGVDGGWRAAAGWAFTPGARRSEFVDGGQPGIGANRARNRKDGQR